MQVHTRVKEYVVVEAPRAHTGRTTAILNEKASEGWVVQESWEYGMFRYFLMERDYLEALR